jgi:hypothetical protein
MESCYLITEDVMGLKVRRKMMDTILINITLQNLVILLLITFILGVMLGRPRW